VLIVLYCIELCVYVFHLIRCSFLLPYRSYGTELLRSMLYIIPNFLGWFDRETVVFILSDRFSDISVRLPTQFTIDSRTYSAVV